jgi:hypothetical protein
MAGMTIEERVATSLAVQRYLRAAERFEAASTDFSDSCNQLRAALKGGDRFIANLNGSFHLVTCDAEKNFNIEQVDSL